MTDAVQIFTTIDSKDGARKIADALVRRKLAACVQVLGPIASTYRWKGEIETAEEWLCIAKSRAGLYAEVEAAIRELHPYEVPEILAVPVLAAHHDYLDWLRTEVKENA